MGLIPRFSVIDPDYQYYTNLNQNGNLNCDYYYEDKFRCKLRLGLSIHTYSD